MSALILSLNHMGQPNAWLKWQDAITLKYKGMISWEYGDKDFLFRGGRSRMTGEQSQMEISSIIAIKSKFKFKPRPVSLTNKNLFRRDLHVCGYCAKTFSEAKLTKDHIVPVSKGGLTTWTNCVTACASCNARKEDKSLEQAGMELVYVPYVPDRAEGLILQNRSILADQMDFLRDFLPKHSRLR